jgi:hypothetical protein
MAIDASLITGPERVKRKCRATFGGTQRLCGKLFIGPAYTHLHGMEPRALACAFKDAPQGLCNARLGLQRCSNAPARALIVG